MLNANTFIKASTHAEKEQTLSRPSAHAPQYNRSWALVMKFNEANNNQA